ncbi:MAG: VOC family protein [Pseudomonadota bacterium]
MSGIRAMPVLPVKDVVAAAEFYAGLGFDKGQYWGDPPAFCIMGLGTVTLALQGAEDGKPGPENDLWSAYIYVDDVASLHDRFEAAGATISDLRRDTPYGCDDFDLTDPDGHTIAFGQDRHPGPLGPGL